MERCPTCRARLRETQICPRCRTDLRLPLAAEARSALHLRRAVGSLLRGDRDAARTELNQSLHYKREPLALYLQGFSEFLADREAAAERQAAIAAVQEAEAQAKEAEPLLQRWLYGIEKWMGWKEPT